MGYVVSWYSRVVDVRSWTFDEGSWRRSSRGDTAGWFGWVVGYRWIVVAGSWGRSRLVDQYSRLWRYVGLTKGVSIRLLAHTVGRTWARCSSGRTVRNSESLRGLRGTLQERQGQGKARALPGPLAMRMYRTGAKALLGQSRVDESEGSEGFAVPKPCGLWLGSRQSRADKRTGAKALSCQSRADEQTGAKALSCQSRTDERTGAKALSCQSRADERTGQEAEAKMGVILALRR